LEETRHLGKQFWVYLYVLVLVLVRSVAGWRD